MLPKCRFFRGRGHYFQWNRKTGSPDYQFGAVSGVSGIRYFRRVGPGYIRSLAGPQESTSNPGPVRPRITPPDTHFPELCAKTGALLHTFSGIGRYSRFRANRAFYADVQNAFVRFWEAKPGAGWDITGSNEKKGCFGDGF